MSGQKPGCWPDRQRWRQCPQGLQAAAHLPGRQRNGRHVSVTSSGGLVPSRSGARSTVADCPQWGRMRWDACRPGTGLILSLAPLATTRKPLPRPARCCASWPATRARLPPPGPTEAPAARPIRSAQNRCAYSKRAYSVCASIGRTPWPPPRIPRSSPMSA